MRGPNGSDTTQISRNRERRAGPKRARHESLQMSKAKVAIWGGGARPDRRLSCSGAAALDERWRRCARPQGGAGRCRSRSPTAERKTVPVRIDALGTVTPIASVAIKARVDTTITGVHFGDGAHVKKGDLLFTLDGRAIEAQIAQTEGMIARDQAQLDGAERDVARYTDLVAKGATPTVNLDNAKTQVRCLSAPRSRPTRACSKI